MKAETIFEALTHTPDEYIDSAQIAMERGKRRMGLRRTLLMAACIGLAAVMAALPIGMMLTPDDPLDDYPSAMFTAQEVADIFNSQANYDTTSYQTISVPTASFLPLNALNNAEHQLVYEFGNAPKKAVNLEEFESFVSSILSQFCNAADISVPSYTIQENAEQGIYSVNLYDSWDDYRGFFLQSQTQTYFTFSPNDLAVDKFQLNGMPVAVDQTKSDEEIIASLDGIRDTLFEIFGVSFSDVEIKREYGEYNEDGVERLIIYFYNQSDDPLNGITDSPRSDYISLDFDNRYNYEDDIVSPDWLRKVDISYYQNRTDDPVTVSEAKTLPLEKAEEYLSKGYVFSGHMCKLCESMQDGVDFTDYDYVSLSYFIEGYTMTNQDKPRIALPVYVFYKYIGEAPNGNLTYAYTYVPAIEVSGMEKYFRQQQERYHGQIAAPSKEEE